jgi:hypothetical protein
MHNSRHMQWVERFGLVEPEFPFSARSGAGIGGNHGESGSGPGETSARLHGSGESTRGNRLKKAAQQVPAFIPVGPEYRR